MTLRVLITAPYLQPEIERFRPIFTAQEIELFVPKVVERCSEAELLGYIEDIDGAICGDDPFTERVLTAATRLKVIAKWGTGIDSIDQQACERLGIAVRNTPNAFSEPVADSVLGYMLAFARRQPWMTEAMRRGVWDKLPGRTLGECTLGIVGVGNIGKAVAKRARAFNMTLLGNDPLEISEGFLQSSGVRMAPLTELLESSDFVSISCDLNPTSRHLFNDAAFARMKRGAVLINCARGPIVDERALERALLSGRLGGAALDVFELEPLPVTSPLLGLAQVLLAPHNANSSPRAWEFVHENTIRNLLEGLGKQI
ncbi:MAG TPA: phosphoglycerate dehydrogenase [Polyangiales bacterium]|nr:phosphoglycerate dehydrogenase [Polyangiales bacterium]